MIKPNISRLPIKYGAYSKDRSEYLERLAQMGITIIEAEYDDLFMQVELPQGWSLGGEGYQELLLDDQGRERASSFVKTAFWDRDAFLSFSRRFQISYEVKDYNEDDYKEKPRYIKDGYEEVEITVEQYQRLRRDGADGYNLENAILYDWGYGEEGEEEYERKVIVQKEKWIQNPEYVHIPWHVTQELPFHYEVRDWDGTVLFASESRQTFVPYQEDDQDQKMAFFDNRTAIEKQGKEECAQWLTENYPDWENPLAYWDLKEVKRSSVSNK